MTTTIRGKSGKSALRELLDQHDTCQFLFESASCSSEPFNLQSVEDNFFMDITKDELMALVSNRLQVINTKLENLGLKIGDEVENAQ